MDVHELLVRPWHLEQRVPAGRHFAEPAADREHEVGTCEALREAIVHRDAEDAGVAARAVVHEVLAAERARDRELARLAEREHVLACPRRPAALADDDERPLGGGQELAEPLQVLGARSRVRDLDRGRVRDIGLLGEHVLGEREHDRPGPAGERRRVGAGDVLGDPLRGIDLPGRLRDPPKACA